MPIYTHTLSLSLKAPKSKRHRNPFSTFSEHCSGPYHIPPRGRDLKSATNESIHHEKRESRSRSDETSHRVTKHWEVLGTNEKSVC